MTESDTPADGFGPALQAVLDHDLAAPNAAIGGFLGMLLEDARIAGFSDLLPDLERMQQANGRLTAILAEAATAARSRPPTPAEQPQVESRLRHDLRNPLNAIKGYSEILLEDLSPLPDRPFVVDLQHVLACTHQLLGRIDRLSDLGRDTSGPPARPPDSAGLGALVEAPRTKPEPAPAPAARRLIGRILVVDDEPANRDLLSRRLEREGHTVAVAQDGARALAMTMVAEFDLILLDILMPGISGFQVLRELKASESRRHIPVIVISALDQIDSVVSCIEAGAEDYLPKTFNPTLLRARITACLEKKALRDRDAIIVNELKIEKQRSESLLLSILPQSIVNRMRQGESAIADRFDAVTILFCDLVGFTPLAAQLSPRATVELLGTVFSMFDRSVSRWGVEKIKTMGDAYMVAGGIPERKTDHAARVARLAFDMLKDVEEIGRDHGGVLAARIGIHTGEAVAGVIGTNRFVYDVWGDTVNTAARMESHGLAGRIHITASTRTALGPGFAYESRGPIDVKGKGSMETFFLFSRTA